MPESFFLLPFGAGFLKDSRRVVAGIRLVRHLRAGIRSGQVHGSGLNRRIFHPNFTIYGD
jgi:hypothetical protein